MKKSWATGGGPGGRDGGRSLRSWGRGCALCGGHGPGDGRPRSWLGSRTWVSASGRDPAWHRAARRARPAALLRAARLFAAATPFLFLLLPSSPALQRGILACVSSRLQSPRLAPRCCCQLCVFGILWALLAAGSHRYCSQSSLCFLLCHWYRIA